MLEALSALDGAILIWIQDCLRFAVLDPWLKLYTMLGNSGLIWIVISLSMLCFKKTRKAGACALVAMLLGLLCTNVVLKHLVGRARPWLTVEGLIPMIAERDPNSFPSGHTCAAFAAAGVWRYALPRRWMRVTGIIMAALMGFSRLYVGVHFPSDVLVGCLVGLFCAWSAWRLCFAWEGRHRLSTQKPE